MPQSESLPVLENLRIASPCTADWEQMSGDERVRFCSQCQLQVFNLSALPRAEAEAFMAEQTGRVCVRMYRRADGTVLTADCPVGLARVRQKTQRMCLSILALAGSLLWGTLMAWGFAVRPSGSQVTPRAGLFARWQKPDQGYWAFGDVCIPRVGSGTAPAVLIDEDVPAE